MENSPRVFQNVCIAPRKPWDLLMKNPHSSKDTPLKPFLLISEMNIYAISSSFSRPSLIAVVWGMSEYPIISFKAFLREVVGLRLATLSHLEAEMRPFLKQYKSTHLLCNLVCFSTITISSSEQLSFLLTATQASLICGKVPPSGKGERFSMLYGRFWGVCESK